MNYKHLAVILRILPGTITKYLEWIMDRDDSAVRFEDEKRELVALVQNRGEQ